MSFMNFMSNVLDAIPVVGHVKAAGHYMFGDKDGASKAFYQSSRTSAVLAGGAIGSIAGPIGAAAAAAKAGICTDFIASYSSGENRGFFKDWDSIKDDIYHRRSIAQSSFIAGMHIVFDAVGGIGMGGVSSAAVENVGLNLASNAEGIVGKSAEELTRQIAVRRIVSVSAKTTVGGVGQTAVIATRRVVVANALAVRAVKEVAETATETALQRSLSLVAAHVACRGINGREDAEDDGREDPEDEPENIGNTDRNATHLCIAGGD